MRIIENAPPKQAPETIKIARSAHGRPEGHTYARQSAYVVSSTGARLLVGTHISLGAFGALRTDAENYERRRAAERKRAA